jgi:hypothetical protein
VKFSEAVLVLYSPASSDGFWGLNWELRRVWAKGKRVYLPWIAGILLVSVPVFFQAPLVRWSPEISLALTLVWFLLGAVWKRSPSLQDWGDLSQGFGWSWLAGSLYWGWLRGEPLLHLPVEAIGLPVALWGLWQGQGKLGHTFYLGSLLGTAITDGYFYLINVVPQWRALMAATLTDAPGILQAALSVVGTPWGITSGLALALLLLFLGLCPLRSRQPHAWVFSGTLVGTLLVDSLFGLAAWLSVSVTNSNIS